MLGCGPTKPSAVMSTSPLVNINNTYNFGKPKNSPMEFLVLLDESDMVDDYFSFLGFNKSIKTKLLKKQNRFPGKMNIVSFAEIEKETNYIVEDSPVPKEIYMKLPDKGIYVLSSKYKLKYLFSKQNELKNIFILLGAKKISWTVIKNNSTSESVGAEMGVSFPQVDIHEGVGLEHSNSTNNHEAAEMTFDYDENIINNISPAMFSNNNFYFLPKEYEWHDIIIRRLEKKLITDKYTFVYSNNLSFKTTLSSKLKMIDVNFNYNTEELNNLKIQYEIEYYKLSDTVKDTQEVIEDKQIEPMIDKPKYHDEFTSKDDLSSSSSDSIDTK